MQALGRCGVCVPRRLFHGRTDFLPVRANMAAIRQAAACLHLLRYIYISQTVNLINEGKIEKLHTISGSLILDML